MREGQTFESFKTEVRLLCNAEDFKKHEHKLISLRVSGYKTFTSLLRMGACIRSSFKGCEEIFKLSIDTLLTEEDIVGILPKARFINSLIDSNP